MPKHFPMTILSRSNMEGFIQDMLLAMGGWEGGRGEGRNLIMHNCIVGESGGCAKGWPYPMEAQMQMNT